MKTHTDKSNLSSVPAAQPVQKANDSLVDVRRRFFLQIVGTAFAGLFLCGDTESCDVNNVEVPNFTLTPAKDTQFAVSNIDVSAEQMRPIAADFSRALQEYYMRNYLQDTQRSLEVGTLGDIQLSNLLNWIEQYLSSNNQILAGKFNEFYSANRNISAEVKISSFELIFEFLNAMLVQHGKLLCPTYKGHFVELYDVTEAFDCEIDYKCHEVHVPVFYTGNPKLPGSCHLNDTIGMRGKSFSQFGDYTIVRKDRVLQFNGKNAKRTSQFYKTSEVPNDYEDELVLNIVRHEATHALLNSLFPKTVPRNIKLKEFLIEVSTTFDGDVMGIKGPYSANHCGELAAIGSAIAHFDYGHGVKLSSEFRAGRSDFSSYRLANDVLVKAISLATKLPNTVKSAVEQIAINSNSNPWRILCQRPELTAKKIRRIGESMWHMGHAGLEQINAQISAASR